MATELVEMEPSLAEAVRDDGTMMVELIGGLYGLIESGWLWYHNIADFLISLGFIVSDSDNCLFLKEEIKIALYHYMSEVDPVDNLCTVQYIKISSNVPMI